MAKQKFKITNWSTYNKALINRGSLTFWLDDGAIQAWYESATPSSRGRPQRPPPPAGRRILTFELLTGTTPFTGDSALAVAYQRMDHDVPPPSTRIAGVPRQFDDLVRRAATRDPAGRYADAGEMVAALDVIIDELGLPPFRVPAPRNSAQHLAATRFHNRPQPDLETTAEVAPPPPAPATVPRQHTREITRDQQDWAPIPAAPADDEYAGEYDEYDYSTVSGQFAGIDMAEFYWARQRAKRMVLMWVIAVLTVTGLTAAAAWTLGSNIATLIQ